MDIRGCLPFLVFFVMFAFFGYRRFVRNESLSPQLSPNMRRGIYCGILLALAVIFTVLCLWPETASDTIQPESELWKTFAILVSFVCLLAVINLLLPFKTSWRAVVAFSICLLPILFYLLFRNVIPVSILLWVLIFLQSAAVIALVFFTFRT